MLMIGHADDVPGGPLISNEARPHLLQLLHVALLPEVAEEFSTCGRSYFGLIPALKKDFCISTEGHT